jgi:hypothetical protein
MEIYYRRINGNLETVVYFLPDLSSTLPSPKEWTIITRTYRQALYGPDKTTTTTTKEEKVAKEVIIVVPAEVVKDVEPPLLVVPDVMVVADVEEVAAVAVPAAGESLEVPLLSVINSTLSTFNFNACLFTHDAFLVKKVSISLHCFFLCLIKPSTRAGGLGIVH